MDSAFLSRTLVYVFQLEKLDAAGRTIERAAHFGEGQRALADTHVYDPRVVESSADVPLNGR